MKICFYGDLFDAFQGKITGGGELQLVTIAKYLATHGFQVSIIDFHTQGSDKSIDGVNFIFLRNYNAKIFGVKYAKLLYRIDADIYFSRIRSFHHIIPFIISRLRNSKFVLSLAHDLDVSSFQSRWKYFYKEKSILYFLVTGVLTECLFYYVLKRADLIITQHEDQFNSKIINQVNKVLIRNIFDFSKVQKNYNLGIEVFDYIYVGSLNLRKGLSQLLIVLNAVPEKKILIIGRPYGSTENFKIYNRIKQMSSVKLISYADQSEVFYYLSNSQA
jgi:hypothetical protein